MLILLNCIIVLAGVVVASKLARILQLPGPLVQISVGALIASSGGLAFEIHPETFMFLFLASLLFLDGSRLPFSEVKKDGIHVLSLAFGLVLCTGVGLGFALNYFLPNIPLSVCIGLAAIISLTDPIAVASIAQRVPIPKRMMHILEGESLLNDATGLVCMRFAIAAATTGIFVVENAVREFTIMVVWGIVIGVVTMVVLSALTNWFSRRYGEISFDQIIITLLAAFGSFWIAEHWHASGVLAAVSAGVTLHFLDMTNHNMAQTRLQRKHFWDTIQYGLNGAIFILMGEQLPKIISTLDIAAAQAGHDNPIFLLYYVGGIMVFLIVSRFLWCHVTTYIEQKRLEGRTPEKGARLIEAIRPSFRASLAMSFAGVRGAVTLAGIMTFPLLLPDGSPFPGREFAIVVAVGVIITSLVLSTLVLPPLLNGLEFPDLYAGQGEMRDLEREAAKAAIAAIEVAGHKIANSGNPVDVAIVSSVTQRILEKYRDAVTNNANETDAEEQERYQREAVITNDLLLVATKAEREFYKEVQRKNGASEHDVRSRLSALDLTETKLQMQKSH